MQSLGIVAIDTQIDGLTKSIVYQVSGENSHAILGHLGLKEFGLAVYCSDDCSIKDGRARIVCRAVEVHEETDDACAFEGQSHELIVKLTRSEQKVVNLMLRQGQSLLLIGKSSVLGPCKTQMVVLPF